MCESVVRSRSIGGGRGELRALSSVWIGNLEVADDYIEIMASGNELPQRAARRSERVKLLDLHARFFRSATELREFAGQFRDDFRVDWIIDSRTHFYIAGIEADLPRIGGRNHHVAADKLAPMHMIAKRGGEKTQA